MKINIKNSIDELKMMLGIKQRPSYNFDSSKPFTKEESDKAIYCLNHYGDFYADGILKISYTQRYYPNLK